MGFNFPAAPALNQIYSPAADVNFQWNGVAWIGGASVARVEPAESFYDLSGLASVDILVPAWAKAGQLIGSIFVPAGQQVVCRMSDDGTTFKAGASDYQIGGAVHNTGSNSYTKSDQTALSFLTFGLVGDTAGLAHQFTAEVMVQRATTSQLFAYKAYAKAGDPAATFLLRTAWWSGWMGAAVTTALTLKALRVLSTSGVFGAGSHLHVKWLGNIAQSALSGAVPEAPNDSVLYSRRNAAWVKAPALPSGAAGPGLWQSMQSTTGGALILPAGG